MEKLRILQLVQRSQLRGAEIFASQLANHLVKLGHDVKMVCIFDGPSLLPFHGAIIGLHRPESRRFFDLEGWRKLAAIVDDFGADIVQANASDTLKYAAMSKKLFRWKSRLVLRNASKVSDFVGSRAKLLLNKFFLQSVDYVVSVSENCRLDFISLYHYSVGKIETIPVGIEPESFSAESVYNKSDLPALKGDVILNVGSLVPEKNQIALLRVARRIVKSGRSITVLIVGDGKLREMLQDFIDKGNLTECVFILGYRNDVSDIMKRCNAFVLPSVIEGLPAVVLESFYSKLPVIAYNVGGIAEVIKPGDTGWLVEKDDEERLYMAIQEALDKDSNNIVTNAYNLVVGGYTNEAIARRFHDVYTRVL